MTKIHDLKIFFKNINTRGEKLNGQTIAAVLKILIEREVAPGGPYYDERGEVNPELNYEIARWLNNQDVILENLNNWLKNNHQIFPNNDSAENKRGQIDNQLTRAIVNTVAQRFQTLPANLKNLGLEILKITLDKDQDQQIILLSYFFKLALDKNGAGITDKLLTKLGAANLYLWIAYTIYDNFMDQEADPKTLTIANIAYREFITTLQPLIAAQPGATKFFQEIMDDMEAANYQEITGRAWPNVINHSQYNLLAEKSLPHAFGPLFILLAGGYDRNSEEFKNLSGFFKNYLIARQLNDDAHDWEEDLKRGFANSVSALMIKDNPDKVMPQIADNFSWLREIFWSKTIVEINQIILKHIKIAKNHMRSLTILTKPEYLKRFLKPLMTAAYKSFNEKKRITDFFQAYRA